jgi:L-arabinose isomerase
MLLLESVLVAMRQVRGGETERCGENEKPHFAKCECGLVAASLRKCISCVVGFNQAKEAQAHFSNWVKKSRPRNQ